ncbi:hypothetical protein N657DRAFT_535992, partial [Parathielavia appendiculata]
LPPPPPAPELGQPCSQSQGDCAGNLTCIPLSPNCTDWSDPICSGTCQDLTSSLHPPPQIYTLCGGWALYDDCDERREMCVADPRHAASECGPACDGPGVCWPFADVCQDIGGEEAGEEMRKMKCPEGKVCFKDMFCLPLRFGSDHYEKSKLEEVTRTDQDGYQED